MDLIKIMSEMVRVRDEIHELATKIDWKTKELDRLISEMVEFMKHRKLIESRKVGSKSSG